jgi:hypothetical protein
MDLMFVYMGQFIDNGMLLDPFCRRGEYTVFWRFKIKFEYNLSFALICKDLKGNLFLETGLCCYLQKMA